MRKLVLAAALVGLAALPSSAMAYGANPFASSSPCSLCGFGGCNTKPVFQAAPWYLYWPYHGHFQTPAPMWGAFHGPAVPGNFPVNPYFPSYNTGGAYGSPFPR
jgi:hypothetical protein